MRAEIRVEPGILSEFLEFTVLFSINKCPLWASTVMFSIREGLGRWGQALGLCLHLTKALAWSTALSSAGVPPGQEAWFVVFQSTSSIPNGNAQQHTCLHLHSHELTSSFFNRNIIGLSKLELLCSLETSGHFPSQSWWFVIFFSEISRDVQILVCMNN